MTFTRTHAAVLFAALASAAAAAFSIHAQAPSFAPPPSQVPQPAVRPQPAPVPRAVIFLDPAHGGSETGADLGNQVAEKDAVLAFTQRLRAALASARFAVVTTRDSDLAAPMPPDQRAESANRAHALACIVVHATASGTGVHIYTSTLPPASAPDDPTNDLSTPFTPTSWESAQTGFVEQSRKLSDLLKATLAKSSLPVLTGTAPLRPLDNLMCPAIAVEIAPNSASVNAGDSTYQQQIVVALASALENWRNQNTPQAGGTP